jgi:hypothetical protein
VFVWIIDGKIICMQKDNEIQGKHGVGHHAANAAPSRNDATRRMAPTQGQAAPNYAQQPHRSAGETRVMSPVASPYQRQNAAYSNVRPASPYGAMGWNETPQAAAPHKNHHVGRIIAIICAILLAIYVAGAFFFMDHLYPESTMSKQNVGLKTSSDIASAVTSIGQDYSVKVSGDGLDFSVSSSQMGMTIDGQKVATAIFADHNPWAWPVEIAQNHDVSRSLVSQYSESGLSQIVTAQVDAVNATATQPVNATIAYTPSVSQFKIIPEQAGTMVDASAVKTQIASAVVDMDSSVTLGNDQLVQPTVLSTDPTLSTACTTANGYLKADVTLTLGDAATKVGEVNAAQIQNWVVLGNDLSVTFDQDAMSEWTAQLASSLNTEGTQRTYTRPDGRSFTVSGGTYGWEIDTDSLTSELQNDITTGQVATLAVPTNFEGVSHNGTGTQDWGAYVDVDLTEQHARFYDASGTLKWEADCVTGAPTDGHDTPQGVWRIFNKESPSVLKGDIQASTGQPSYETEVAYWMAFTYSGCGLHDATWQSAFGGTRYKDGYGSHGCVNLSLDAAASLYDLVAVGNAVVVHA